MLDRQSLRVQAVALAVVSWAVMVWLQAVPGLFDRFGQLRGVDFLQFYTAGWFVASGRMAHLYDFEAFSAALPRLAPGIGDLLFLPVYPPQLALVFAPLGGLSYPMALAIWTSASVLFYVVATSLMLRLLPAIAPYRLEAWCLALGFPPFVQLIAHGQIGTLALVPLVGAFAAFRSDRSILAGIALGLLAFKPQFATFALMALVLWPSTRLLAGLALGAGLQVAASAAVLGPSAWADYAAVVVRLLQQPEAFEPKRWAMHGLRGLVTLLLGRSALATASWLALDLAAVWAVLRAWRRHENKDARFAVLVFGALLVNPHLYVYDLTLLAPALACLASWLVHRADYGDRLTPGLVYSLVWLPLLTPLSAVVHVQLTSVAMLALVLRLASPSSLAPAPASSVSS